MQRYPTLPYIVEDNTFETSVNQRVLCIINHAIVVGSKYGIYHNDIRRANVVMNPQDNNPFLIDWDMCNHCDQCINYLRTPTDNSKGNTDVLKAILEASFGFNTERKELSRTFEKWVKNTMEKILAKYDEEKINNKQLNLRFLQEYFFKDYTSEF
eukprot:GHVR01089358.1.p1 GENE.GHVR01089358.1~~GHVR01089358.1.p1  ORF type:complete len:155 (-),score=12.59 GHVR01089358.1:116-580(-)